MKKIFKILMLMLAAALVACGGGGGSSGGNPNQPFLTTTAGTEVILPVGAARDYQISGGVPPYRVVNPNEAVAIGQISGNTLTIGTLLVGVVKLDVLDHSGALVSINVKSGSSVPLYTTAPGALTVGVGASVARTFWIGGGGAPYTVEGGDSNVALVQMLSDTQWRVTGVAIGSTTIKIRDAAGVEVSIALEVGSPELRISPTDLTMPVGLEAVAKLSGGQPPYRVAGGIPAAITATIVGDELHIKGSFASTLDISVMDAAGQIVKVKVEINTATTSIRLSPSASSVSETDNQDLNFTVFGAAKGEVCFFSSDPSLLKPRLVAADPTKTCLTSAGPTTPLSFVVETGSQGNRCVNANAAVSITVVDAARSTGQATVTILNNGADCGLGVFSVSPSVLNMTGSSIADVKVFGVKDFTKVIATTSNAAIATAVADQDAGVVRIKSVSKGTVTVLVTEDTVPRRSATVTVNVN